MKIADFKNRFLELTADQQMTAINEMEKADVGKDHMQGIDPSRKPQTEKEFKSLIDWCKANQKATYKLT